MADSLAVLDLEGADPERFVEIDIRFVSQDELEDITASLPDASPGAATRRRNKKLSDLLADARIRGWRRMTRDDAEYWGYPDFDALPVEADGTISYSEAVARELYRRCQWNSFGSPIVQCSDDIKRKQVREKKRRGDSSEKSPASTG